MSTCLESWASILIGQCLCLPILRGINLVLLYRKCLSRTWLERKAKDKRTGWAPWKMERNLESISLISALWAVTCSQKEHALSVGLQVPRCAMLIAKWPQLPTIPHSLLCSYSLQCDFAAFPVMKWNLFLHS